MGPRIEIVPYDPAWPGMYEEECRQILAAVGDCIAAVEHVGSTAVPGLPAKPIIDIMIGVRELRAADACIPRLTALGYEYVPEYEAAIPDRRYFCKGPPEQHTHHLHLVEVDGSFWDRHLLFRDYLRSHPEASRQYYVLKASLAARHDDDRSAYSEGKTAFVQDIEERARAARDGRRAPDQARP